MVVRELPSVLLERAQEAARAAGPGVPVDARTAEVVRKSMAGEDARSSAALEQ